MLEKSSDKMARFFKHTPGHKYDSRTGLAIDSRNLVIEILSYFVSYYKEKISCDTAHYKIKELPDSYFDYLRQRKGNGIKEAIKKADLKNVKRFDRLISELKEIPLERIKELDNLSIIKEIYESKVQKIIHH